MIQVDGLSIAYQGSYLFRDTSFSLQEGERCGLVGRNGSGKSTLLRIITGQEIPDSGVISIRKNYRLGMLSQHITFSQASLIEEACLALHDNEKDSVYKAEKILFGLGFKEEDLWRSPHDFSGGYQIRLHLAKLLIAEPNCLLLDEPTNYLDIVSIRWFTRFLKQWKGEFILISHDRDFMDSVTTHTMGIHRNKVRKLKGGTVPFYEQIVLEEEIHEKTRVNLEKKKAHAQSFIERFGAKATKAAQAQSRVKMLSRIPTLEKLKELYHLEFNFNEADFPGKLMLDAKHVSFDYTGNTETPLIKNFSLEVEKGSRIAIIGKNGRGKSTLLKLLIEELTPLSGTVRRGHNVHIGYFGQSNIDRLHPKHTVEQEIALANTSLSRSEVKSICGLMMFSGTKSEKTASVLSGGEKSRVLLGKIVATPCNLLLLDEPTHHLDMESIEALIDALEEFSGSVILVTHSELILRRLNLDKIIICRENDQELFLGNYDDFLDKKGWEEEEGQKPKKKANDTKKQKQERAEQVGARSKALKPIEEEIARKEARITMLESEQLQSQEEMIALAQSGKSQEIQEHAKAIAQRGKEIEQLYEDLELLLQQRDTLRNQHQD